MSEQKIIEEESKRSAQKNEEDLKFKYEQYRVKEKDRAIDRLDHERIENLKEDFKKSLLQK